MNRFTLTEKMIAFELLSGEKNKKELVESLKKKIDFDNQKFDAAIERLQKLKFVEEKEGKYFLSKDLLAEFKKIKEIEEKDSFRLKLRAFIEIQAIERSLLEQQLEKIETALKKEKDFTIYNLYREEIIKNEEDSYYSSFIDVILTVRNFQALIKFVIFYGPTAIEIIKPARIDFSVYELQEGLLDLIQMIQKYTEFALKLMNRQELEEFNKQLLKKWKIQQITKKALIRWLTKLFKAIILNFTLISLKD